MIKRFFHACLLLLIPTAVMALDGLPMGDGPAVVTIHARGIDHPLDATALRSLPAETFTTETIWTDGEQTFTGVRVTELLTRLGVDHGTLTLIAANDYRITINVDHFTPDGALLAYDRNGTAMTLRDKGPVWMVYPYDADPRFRTEITYANSIWQLDRIEIAE